MKITFPYFIILVFLLPLHSFSQLACESLDAGSDVTLDVSMPCTDLLATLIGLPNTDTSTYVVGEPVCPLPPINGGSPSNVVIDDRWSQIINIPFEFEYYQNTYTSLVIGANGQISFDTSLADTGSGYVIGAGDLLPTTNGTFTLNTIYGAYHDMDPSISPDPTQINYLVAGTAPFRSFILNFDDVEHFGSSCSSFSTTQQVILYESSNVIEVNLVDKPACTGWNGGRATLGIQGNNTGEFAVPPGRNTGVWDAVDESYRFIPDGPEDPNTTVVWTAPDGSVISSDLLAAGVCSPIGTTTYTVTVTFTLPNGTTTTVFDTVNVTVGGATNDFFGCQGDSFELDATDPAANNYIWTFDDGMGGGPVVVQNSPDPTFDATQTGIYDVTIEYPSAPSGNMTFNVTIYPQPVIATQPEDFFICDDSTMPNSFDLTQNDDDVLGGQDPTEFDNITYHTSQADANMGSNNILNPTTYPATGGTETIYVRIEQNAGLCFATAFFTITYSQASAGPMTSLDACDLDSDGTVSLDLQTLKGSEALNGQDPLDYRVSFHPTQMDADGNTSPLANPYVTNVTPQQVFVRVENRDNTDCYGTDSFDITIAVAPEFVQPTPMEMCDEVPNDGIAEFDLESKTDEITNGPNPNAMVTYHLSQLEADNGMNPQSSPFENTMSSFQIIYVRVANASSPTCYNVVELELNVNDSPEIEDPIMDYVECDNDGDGSEVFDLTSKDLEILDGLVGVTL
ncbi:hypothetical protein ACFQO1_12300, partial [Jejudonia soesokkakensis]